MLGMGGLFFLSKYWKADDAAQPWEPSLGPLERDLSASQNHWRLEDSQLIRSVHKKW